MKKTLQALILMAAFCCHADEALVYDGAALASLPGKQLKAGNVSGEACAALGKDSLSFKMEKDGLYRVVLRAFAPEGSTKHAPAASASALGFCRFWMPSPGVWTDMAQFAAVDRLRPSIEIKGAAEGLQISKLSFEWLGPVELKRQDAIIEPEPNPMTPQSVNPPSFRWAPVPGARSYSVSYRRQGEDWPVEENAVLPREGSEAPPLFHRPLRPFAAGEWQWRLKVDGKTFGVYSFSVLETTPKWEIPEWSSIFERFPKKHPRILFGEQDLAKIRESCLGPMKAYAGRLVADLEGKIGESFNLGKLGNAPMETHSMESYGALRELSGVCRPIPDFLVLGLALGRKDFIDEALRRAWIAAKLDPEGGTSQKADDFKNASIMSSLALCYDLAYERLSPSERSLLKANILSRVKQTRYSQQLSANLFGAHAWQIAYCCSAMAAMAIWDEEPEAKDFVEDAIKLYVAFYPWFGGPDGGSAECAHYGLETDMLPALAARQSFLTFAKLDLAGNPWLKNSAWYCLYAYPNDVKSSWFGDGSPNYRASIGKPAPAFAAIAASLFKNPYAAEFAARNLDLESVEMDKLARGPFLRLLPLLYGPFDKLPRRPLGELPEARLFADTGTMIANSDMEDAGKNITLEFRSSSYGAFAHAHADQNSFNIMAAGENIVADAGYYVDWHDKHHYEYAIQTKAHNTLLIDGKGQPVFSSLGWGQITGFKQGDGYVWVRGDASRAYPGSGLERFDRDILWLGSGSVKTCIVYDSVKMKDARPSELSWLLHLTAKPEFKPGGTQLNASREKSELQVNWLAPAGLEISATDKFDTPPVFGEFRKEHFVNLPPQWHLTAKAKAPAGELRFVTILQVRLKEGAGAFAEPSLDGSSLRIGKLKVDFDGKRFRIAGESKAVEFEAAGLGQ